MKNLIFTIYLLASLYAQAQEVPKLHEKNGKYALVNSNGKVVSDYYSAVYDFKFGIAQVRQFTNFGAINRTGEIVMPVKFSVKEIKSKYPEYLKNYAKQNPDNEEMKKYIAELEKQKADNYYENDNYTQAIKSYQKVLQFTGGTYKIYDNIGSSYYATEQYDSAVVYYEKALSLDNENANTLYRLGYAYAKIKEYQKSLETFDKMGSGYKKYILTGKASTYSKMQDYKKAYETTKELIKLENDNYSNYFNLSFYALFINKPQKAITVAKKSLELKPEVTGVYTNLALGYVLNNEFKKAKPIYLEWKDKHFPNDDRLCKEVFLQDIKDLEAAGITHKDFEKVRKLLK